MKKKTGGADGGKKDEPVIPTISAVVDRAALVELLYDPFDKCTALAVFENGCCRIEESYTTEAGERLVQAAGSHDSGWR